MKENVNGLFSLSVSGFPKWLRLDDDGILYYHVCRQHPDIADQKSGMFNGKTVDRRDTLSSHKSSAKHAYLTKMNSIDMKSCSTQHML
jgi:hypothetical protein